MKTDSIPSIHAERIPDLHLARGRALPLGASAHPDGINFVLLCRHGTAVSLVILDADGRNQTAEIPLHPLRNRTGDHWHILVGGLPPLFSYGFRVDGPVGNGHFFDPSKVLLDPSASALTAGTPWGVNTEPAADRTARRSVFLRRAFNWRDDAPPLTPFEDTIIYEMHVRGFTCHSTSLTARPGTFAALAEKIPYLKALGVTALELLPVHEFDESDCPFFDPKTGARLRNFWGYNTISFGALKAGYAATEHNQLNEFREMVRLLHEAGIEIFLDVVFNHTGEGDNRGRTYNFRGLDNSLYYMIGSDGRYLNFSGCGNTVNCNHPVVRHLILNSLRYWVADMHVDGLRFDLASILGRDYAGRVMLDPPIIESIAEDGVLSDTKLIAEPWDAGGLYQVGNFPYGQRWSEWNGRYRDDVRRFWCGEPGMVGALATRLCGSADLYQAAGRLPRHSINFITCHDGFTLWDLVSYSHKHNEANGEGNRDGSNDNHSWNCGVEGPTDDPKISGLRKRQVRNLLTTLFLSQGTPMLLSGDEVLRTQGGNNNAWCQDNDISWVDWSMMTSHASFLRFAQELIALRKRHPALRRRTWLQPGDIIWHGTEPYHPDWSSQSHTLAMVLDGQRTGREPDRDIYLACNNSREPVPFRIPPAPHGQPWRRVIDTALASPLDIVSEEEGPVQAAWEVYNLAGFSTIVLIAEPR